MSAFIEPVVYRKAVLLRERVSTPGTVAQDIAKNELREKDYKKDENVLCVTIMEKREKSFHTFLTRVLSEKAR